MPTYEYRCLSGHDIERFYKISEAPGEVECPTCGAVATRRISGGAGLLFKGSGFYITDYGKDGKKDQRQAAQGAGEKGGSEKGGSEKGSGERSSGSAEGSSGSGTAAKGESKGGSAAPTAPAPKKPAGE